MSALCDLIVGACLKELPISNLYEPLKKTKENPELGIKVINKSAKFVIRDSAVVAFDYLPLHCFCSNKESIINQLKKNVNKKQLSEFIKETETKISSRLLLDEMLKDTGNVENTVAEPTNDANIYGNYGYAETELPTTANALDLLCRLLDVVK